MISREIYDYKLVLNRIFYIEIAITINSVALCHFPAGQDYTFPGALRLPSLSSRTCITGGGILNDAEVVDSETFTLSLSSSSNNVVYRNRNATVTIMDDDGMIYSFCSFIY